MMAWFNKIGVMFRRYSRPIATTGVVSVLGAYLYTQTFGLRYYKRLMAHYKDGAMLPVDSVTQRLFERVLHRVNLSVDDEARLDIFTSFPPDPVHRGSLQLRSGAVIGLPSTFYYQTVGDVERNTILVGQEMVDWNSSAGEELQNALILSDKAKAFVIARELFHAKSFTVHLDTFLQTSCLLLAYYSGVWLNSRLLLTLRLKPWARFIAFSAVGAAWLSFYIMISDGSHCWNDNSVDKAAAKLRKAYAEGGVEYYEKVLRRNCALRTLLGSKGAKQFTRYGNVVSVWRNRGVQLTSRRDNLLKYLAEYDPEKTVGVNEGHAEA